MIIINNDCIVKARIDSQLYNTLKAILSKKKETQQSLIEECIKKYILENLEIIIAKGSD